MENKELKERLIDKKTGIEYRLVGDYYLPNIVVQKPRRTGNIGKYGRLRLKYLEEHYKAECILMRVNNELKSHLLDIEDECKERVEQLVKEMAEKENVTEELINAGISQSERLIKLNESARRQMRVLENNKGIRELENLQKEINENNILKIKDKN